MNEAAGFRRHATILLSLAVEAQKDDRPEIADKLIQLAAAALERAGVMERDASQRVVQQRQQPWPEKEQAACPIVIYNGPYESEPFQRPDSPRCILRSGATRP
jgi:hypothetical protein